MTSDLGLAMVAASAVLGGIAAAVCGIAWTVDKFQSRRPWPWDPASPPLRCHTCGATRSARTGEPGEFWCITNPRKPVCRTCVRRILWEDSNETPQPLLNEYSRYLLITPTHKATMSTVSGELPVVLAELGDVPCVHAGCTKPVNTVDWCEVVTSLKGERVWERDSGEYVPHCGQHPQSDHIACAVTQAGTPKPTRWLHVQVEECRTVASYSTEAGQWQTEYGTPPEPWHPLAIRPEPPEPLRLPSHMATWQSALITDSRHDSTLPPPGTLQPNIEWGALTSGAQRDRYWLSDTPLPERARALFSGHYAVTGDEMTGEMGRHGYTYRSHRWDGSTLVVTYTTYAGVVYRLRKRNRYTLKVKPASPRVDAALRRLRSRIAQYTDPAAIIAAQPTTTLPVALELIANTDTTLETLTEMLTLVRDWSKTPHTDDEVGVVIAGCRNGVYTKTRLEGLLSGTH